MDYEYKVDKDKGPNTDVFMSDHCIMGSQNVNAPFMNR